MPHPRRIDDALYTHFITFSCYHRRRLLDHDQPKRIFLGVLNDLREKFAAKVVGFVQMPDHVHLLIPVPEFNCAAGASSGRAKLPLSR